jgi:hypothetical protein
VCSQQEIHPRVEVMSPYGYMALLDVKNPYLATQNLDYTPTTVPIHYLSSPKPAEPKEWHPPSLPRSPSGLPTYLQVSNALEWIGISYMGTPRTC